ncbi:MAG: hypothetical protein HC852_01410 [Acaryochloridaceae cyanobacterium RU_4_10]|nr:hypothetical protein [Acaryochloridaceae cyanobacterium RU_4_10]
MNRVEIFTKIEQECEKQDTEWDGALHDDEHSLEDWIDFIDAQINRVEECESTNLLGARERLIKVAALAVAAIESLDRKIDKEEK